VITVAGWRSGVSVSVGPGLVHLVDGGRGVQSEEVGEHGGGQPCREIGKAGAAPDRGPL